MTAALTDVRKLITRIFYGFMLLFLLIRFYDHNLLHQLHQPVLTKIDADITFWLFYLLKIPELLTGHYYIAMIFDIMLFGSAFTGFVLPKNKFIPYCYFILFTCYFITFSSYATHHGHDLVSVVLLAALFCFRKEKNFIIFFYFQRYYLLFIMASAAMWKLFRGSLFHPDQMSLILKEQHVYCFIYPNSSIHNAFISFLINNPVLNQTILLLGFLLQFSFSIGFFTRKYDRLLLVFLFLFLISDYIIMDLSFFPMYILGILLYKWKAIEEEYEKLGMIREPS